jgi:hypothetical protein
MGKKDFVVDEGCFEAWEVWEVWEVTRKERKNRHLQIESGRQCTEYKYGVRIGLISKWKWSQRATRKLVGYAVLQQVLRTPKWWIC